MSVTRNGSISIAIPDEGAPGDGKERWARVDLEDFFWIGRCSICNLRISGDTQVSRLQATIHREEGGYLLTDMQSRNGTSVNGRRIQAIKLVPGDRVKVGQTLFEFEPENREDTFFHHGTSRHVGDADLELKSFPCSINMDRVPGFVMQPVEGSVQIESPPPAPVAPRIAPKASSLDAFITIVTDRLVCELQAGLGVVFIPPVGPREARVIARGFRDGKLEILEPPWETVRRVATNLTKIPPGVPPNDGERLVWEGHEVAKRLVHEDHTPRMLGFTQGFTIAMPRVGRVGTHDPLPEPTNGLAWIHVESAFQSRTIARLVEEVASAVNVSVIRFLERGSA